MNFVTGPVSCKIHTSKSVTVVKTTYERKWAFIGWERRRIGKRTPATNSVRGSQCVGQSRWLLVLCRLEDINVLGWCANMSHGMKRICFAFNVAWLHPTRNIAASKAFTSMDEKKIIVRKSQHQWAERNRLWPALLNHPQSHCRDYKMRRKWIMRTLFIVAFFNIL